MRTETVSPLKNRVPEAARKLNMSPRTVWELIKQKKIASVRLERGVRTTDEQLAQFLATHTVPTYNAAAFAAKLVQEKTTKGGRKNENQAPKIRQ